MEIMLAQLILATKPQMVMTHQQQVHVTPSCKATVSATKSITTLYVTTMAVIVAFSPVEQTKPKDQRETAESTSVHDSIV